MRKTTYCRFFFLLIFSTYFSVSVSGQIIGQWCVSANNDTLQEARDVWVNNDGSLIMTGYIGSNGLVMKVNNLGEGQVVWKTYITNCFAVNTVIAFDDTSYLCVGTGVSADTTTGNHWGSSDVVLTRINRDGVILWKKYYGGSKSDGGDDIVKTTDGGFAVVSTTYSTDGQVTATNPLASTERNTWVFKIDPSGNLLWQKSLDYPGRNASGDGERILIADDQQLFVLANYNKGYLIDQGSGAVSFFPYSVNGNPGVISSVSAMCKSYEGDAYFFLYGSQSGEFPTLLF